MTNSIRSVRELSPLFDDGHLTGGWIVAEERPGLSPRFFNRKSKGFAQEAIRIEAAKQARNDGDHERALFHLIEMSDRARGRATGVIILLDGKIFGGDPHFITLDWF